MLSLALALVATGTLFTGCATSGDGLSEEQKQQMIDDTAVLLRSAARNGAMFAIEDDPGTSAWFNLAQQVLGTFLTGKDYSPAAFQQALITVPVKEFKNKWIKFAIFNVIDLYQIYWGRYVQGQVQNNETARKFLESVQDGFKQAVEASTTE